MRALSRAKAVKVKVKVGSHWVGKGGKFKGD